MKTVPLALLLLACAVCASAQDKSGKKPAPVDLDACSPRLDVRELLPLEFAGRRLKKSADLERLPAEGQRAFGQAFLQALCSPRGSAVQELGARLRGPVTIEIQAACGGGSHFADSSRRISFSDTYACTMDAMAVLYHELTHAVNVDHLFRQGSIWETVTLCLNDSHDGSVFDSDGTRLNMMDAQTHAMRALDEGVASGVALAFDPKTRLLEAPLKQFALETKSSAWRKIPWERQQRNEYLVILVISRYLGTERAEAATRLTKLVQAGGKAQPRTFEALLRALSDHDPVEARGRLDGILRGLNAGWDSERAEAASVRRP